MICLGCPAPLKEKRGKKRRKSMNARPDPPALSDRQLKSAASRLVLPAGQLELYVSVPAYVAE